MTDEEWFEMLCRVADGNGTPDDLRIPPFPDPVLQRNTTGAAGSAGLPEVWRFYLDCREVYREVHGTDFGGSQVMLDFGCGWGRIARLFLRDIRLENLYGVDVNPDLVQECAARFGNGNFLTTTPFPPSPFAAGTFDLVTGFSVFSHLSETACRAWLEEFARICKPGAVICLTTRGRSFFDYCQSLRSVAEPGTYPHHLSTMFDDFDAAKARYDAGEFVHSNAEGVTGGGVLSGTFYGETFIPRKFAETGFGPSVELVGWREGGTGGRPHSVMFFSPRA